MRLPTEAEASLLTAYAEYLTAAVAAMVSLRDEVGWDAGRRLPAALDEVAIDLRLLSDLLIELREQETAPITSGELV